MRLTSRQARDHIVGARVARLATVSGDGVPHIVPIVFAVDRDTIYTAVDAKPKTTMALRRLANIAANPAVTLLVDHYAEDWTQLWWARADGQARLTRADEHERGLAMLTARYRPYVDTPPPGPVVAIAVTRWSGWAAAEPDPPPPGPHQHNG